ncbi:hypothetical protein BDW62DRAFT_179031 [Aspergillus aurantiobrunneus]
MYFTSMISSELVSLLVPGLARSDTKCRMAEPHQGTGAGSKHRSWREALRGGDKPLQAPEFRRSPAYGSCQKGAASV